ncbi:MAG: SpoIIE family protein phosphatase, partial [Actinobacteria bacterium]|nr:SpoIIE family protein phosphatase [Actinomycetota bacterium]
GTTEPQYGNPEGTLPLRSYLAVPVISREKVLGGLFLGHPGPARFGEEDERLVAGIAAHASTAIENARLFESETRAREAAEHSQRQLEVLNAAGRAVSSSLELDVLLGDLAETIVPGLADTCVVYLAEEDGSIRTAAGRASSLVTESLGEVTLLSAAALSEEENPVVEAIRGGEVVLLEEIPQELIETTLANPAHRDLVRRLDPSSVIIAPLVRGSNVFGALVLGTVGASGRRLLPDDVPLALQLGRRTAMAVENARLFAKQRTTATLLQHSLLPEELPDLPGISAAARYVAGGPGVDVGGDWYDAMTLHDGSVALIMGDVVGRGVAAASLMGQLKSALRAYSLDGYEPAEVLQRLNAMMHHSPAGDQMATLVYCRFDPSTGVLRVSNAGHPPPLILAPDGGARYFDEAGGMPLGALPGARYGEAVAALAPGSMILLYTDGLVENRATPLEAGMDALRERTSAMAHEELGQICDRLLEFAPGGGEDDTAMLALRWHALDDRIVLHLPARASTLKPLRALLRRWLKEAGADENETYEIIAAVGEAVTNVIRHAAHGASPTFDIEAQRGQSLRIVVRDHGPWRAPDESRPGGRGLGIMQQFMNDVAIRKDGDGTAVTMTRSLTDGAHIS